ncbi:MAG: SDR family NAD(P)-dependent oxidoreductase [Acidobacteriaceae bacterium]
MATSANNSFAVVTGASSGIGYHLARVFAENGFDLLVTSEDTKLADAVQELQALGVDVQSVQADLSKYDEVERLWQAISATGRPVDAIAINAGVGVGGDFARETDLAAELNIIELNVASTVHLAKRVLGPMVDRGAGRILFTSSIAGTMPTPLEAVYGASKAFVLEFAQSLRYELKDTGVTVTALKPGPTDTNFFHRTGMDDTEVGTKGKETNDPADVAKQGFDALMSGEQEVFSSSLRTKVEGAVGKILPDSVKAAQHQKMAEHGTAKS